MVGLADEERIILSMPVKVVRSTVESTGELLAGDKKLYFFSDFTRSTQVRCVHLQICNTVLWLIALYGAHL